jgi:hypothetical protein
VTTQPPQLGRNFWQGVVSRMVKAHNAPIPESDVELIVDYLSRTY